jgi:hypothetical protein
VGCERGDALVAAEGKAAGRRLECPERDGGVQRQRSSGVLRAVEPGVTHQQVGAEPATGALSGLILSHAFFVNRNL